MPNVVEHKKFICVCFGDTNNNKVWQYTLYDDGTALTEWGRVGKGLQHKNVSEQAALKKMREKTNLGNKPDKRYTEVSTVDAVESAGTSSIVSTELKLIVKKQITAKDPVVAKLVEFLVKVNAHQIYKTSGGKITYDATNATFKTPLGVVIPDQVDEARVLLTSLADMVVNRGWETPQFYTDLESYLRLIPHDVGMRKINPQELLPNVLAVQRENDLLDGLATSFTEVQEATKKNGDEEKKVKKPAAPRLFDVSLDIIGEKKQIDRIRKKYRDTKKGMHASSRFDVQVVYAVEIAAMKKAFEDRGKKIGKIQELWHGTKASNLLSIFKSGMYIPPTSSPHVTGRMFGNGVYFANSSTKALNYATNYWSGGGGNTSRTFMFLADVALGKHYVPRGGWGENLPKAGHDSTWAKASQSGVMNDEIIVYKTCQCNLVYLVEFG